MVHLTVLGDPTSFVDYFLTPGTQVALPETSRPEQSAIGEFAQNIPAQQHRRYPEFGNSHDIDPRNPGHNRRTLDRRATDAPRSAARRQPPGLGPAYRFSWSRRQYTGYEAMEMQLEPREASLVEVFRRLPPETAAELSALAERLAAISPTHRIDWSDSWTDDDLRDFRAASLARLDDEESEESR